MENAVVVLSFHGLEDTVRCVDSLVEGSPDAHVFVIDNGSFDGVVQFAEERWPTRVTAVQLSSNLGFAGGMNVGLDAALADGATTVTVLNNDTILPPGAIRALADTAGQGRIVSPEIRYLDRQHEIWFGGGTVDADTGLARHLSESELNELFEEQCAPREMPVLTGCCLTAAAETWRRVGGFDERYFSNFEDSDLSVRARRIGYSLVVDPKVSILHAVSRSFRREYSYLGTYYYARNGLLFNRETWHGSASSRLRFLRRHVVPGLIQHVRRRTYREFARRSVLASAAVVQHSLRSYGRAPRWLEKMAARWARAKDRETTPLTSARGMGPQSP